jgi:hypothetical protein
MLRERKEIILISIATVDSFELLIDDYIQELLNNN